ncbi:MAG TPA: type II toxin-antitoxin system Phd/YefM family antitoxin [Gammaproteobacteria bacterium]|nr:type II toxin-antitoxin system Phd/YefM family antitoxin [Gammaproteobacteria bacterium]
MQNWQIQEAKARFSEVIKKAQQEGPQEITSHGKPVAVVLSREQYERLTGTKESLAAFMRRSPLFEQEDIEFEREQTPTREVAL